MSEEGPFGSFRFIVEWGGSSISFAECSGLDSSTDVIEYREGAEPHAHVRKLAGLHHAGPIILRQGVVKGVNELWEWRSSIVNGEMDRRNITISLLGDDREPCAVWKATRAWPSRYVGPLFAASQSAVAIEELELAVESILRKS